MFSFEFDIIRFIQKARNPILDEFFKFLNFFDTDFFYFLLIPIIWIGYNRKLGIRLFFIFVISAIVNDQLKNLFMRARPYQIDPSLGLIHVKAYFYALKSAKNSFPSGAAQSAALLALIFINHFKNKKWIISIAVLYFFFISLSRIYLGVHFLSDVIGGWIVGFLLFLVYLYVFPKIEAFIEKRPVFSFWVCQGLTLPLILVPGLLRFVFSLLGVFLGLFLSYEFNMFLENSKNFKEFITRAFVSVVGIFALYFLYYFLHKKFVFPDINIISYLMGFWVSFLSSLVYKKLFLGKSLVK